MPARTRLIALPKPVSPTPKSSAANWAVWVKSVFVNADDIDAAASNPSTSPWRASIWSGGAHHGGVVRWMVPLRASAHRTGSANSQANQGIVSR